MYTEGMSEIASVTETSVKKGKSRRKKTGSGFFRRLFIRLMIIICLVVFCGAAGYFAVQYVQDYLQSQRYEAKTALVERELIQCAELCTLKEQYSDIVTIKKRAFLGLARSYSIVRYKAVLRAGIRDFSAIAVTISPDGDSVVVDLPSCEILGNDVTNFEVFDDFQNVFIPIETSEVLSEIEKARDAASVDFLQQGFILDANAHAETVFKSFFTAMGFSHVTVHVSLK